MAVATPTAPTFTSIIAAAMFATAATPGTTVQLDLTTKYGAWVYGRIGRQSATALTRAARVNIRPTDNNTILHPAQAYDLVSSIAAVNATTISASTSVGATSCLLTTSTGFLDNQTICFATSGRLEFAYSTDMTTSTLTFDRSTGLRIAHTNGDTITNGSDVFPRVWLPGGDIYEFTPVNNSGQTVVIAVDAAVYASDTIV